MIYHLPHVLRFFGELNSDSWVNHVRYNIHTVRSRQFFSGKFQKTQKKSLARSGPLNAQKPEKTQNWQKIYDTGVIFHCALHYNFFADFRKFRKNSGPAGQSGPENGPKLFCPVLPKLTRKFIFYIRVIKGRNTIFLRL